MNPRSLQSRLTGVTTSPRVLKTPHGYEHLMNLLTRHFGQAILPGLFVKELPPLLFAPTERGRNSINPILFPFYAQVPRFIVTLGKKCSFQVRNCFLEFNFWKAVV